MVAIIVLILIWSSFTIIPAGYRGVVFNQITGVAPLVLNEGFHFKTPVLDKIIKMDVRTSKVEVEADSASKDLQTVQAKIALNYHLLPDAVNRVYQSIGLEYEYRIIDPAIQEAVKAVTAEFTAEELISKRGEVKNQIKTELGDRLKTYNILVDDFNIINFQFSPEFDNAIEQKVTAEQQALKASRDLDRIKIEAEQKIAQAKAEAESLRIQQQELQNSPEILQLRAIEKWDGKMPLVTGGATPFVDISSLTTEAMK